MERSKLTLIGCGLIGGSMCLALKRRRPDWSVTCLDLPERLPAIREAGVADETAPIEELAAHLPASSLVILAAPVDAILLLLEQIAPHLRPGTVVMDVGSTKVQIMRKAREALPPGIVFIGGHPLAGSERSGVEAADPLLFSNRVFLLCPFPDTPPEALLSMINLAEDLSALPVTIEPEEHDRIMATISHVPQLVAVALMRAAIEEDASHGLLPLLAGQGFLDLTRLAASDYRVWQSILVSNREPVLRAIDRFERNLALLRAAVQGGDLASIWEEASRRRQRMAPGSMPRMRKPDFRALIDQCDKQLIGALGNRMQIARRLGKLKKHQDAPAHDPERERQAIAQRLEWGRCLDLPADMVEEVFRLIMLHATRAQIGTRCTGA